LSIIPIKIAAISVPPQVLIKNGRTNVNVATLALPIRSSATGYARSPPIIPVPMISPM
jgi:hypothetical protein